MKGRRHFVKMVSLAAGASLVSGKMKIQARAMSNNDQFACQHYTWFTYFKREGKEWLKNTVKSFQACINSGSASMLCQRVISRLARSSSSSRKETSGP